MTEGTDTSTDKTPTSSGTSRLQILRHRLLDDNPDDVVTLQPHIQERLTKKTELWAFFLFAFGYFAWSNTTGALFGPLLLQQVAVSASRLSSDPTIHCPEDEALVPAGDKCVVPFGFVHVKPTSYVLLINVVSVWCTIFFSLGTSAFADHGRSSKKLMMTFCTALALTTSFMFIAPLEPHLWWIAGLLSVIGMMFNGATLNYFDAHIPILARHHPTVVRAMVDHGEDSPEYTAAKVRMATFLSGNGSSAGFIGGITLTFLAVAILSIFGTSSMVLSYCMILSGVFVLTFMGAYGFLSYQRTSPPLPAGASYMTYGYVRIGRTIRQMRRLKTMFFYLCSWFILGDGLSSTSIMTILTAQEQLKVSSNSLIIAVLIQYFFAAASMSFWVWLQNNHGVKPMQVVIFNSCLFGLLPIYCLTGLISSNPVGLKQTWELYMMAILYGLFAGSIYGSNRVVFSQFIPLGHENELYALFEMANVSASWIGPLVCTAIIESYGIQHTWWFLASQFYIAAFMLTFVNVDKGHQEAVEFYKNEQAEKQKTESSDIEQQESQDSKIVDRVKYV
ncbi:MAG: autophagy-related protein 22-like protein [Linnemannia gamsii]|nr:MAG: autophagy-related protein 22-like protein [Linnemannia gamsii]